MRERDLAPFKVYPANWLAVRWFLISQTQIRALDGGVLGFDYPACDYARQRAGLPEPDAWDFEAFRILEHQMTKIRNEGAGNG